MLRIQESFLSFKQLEIKRDIPPHFGKRRIKDPQQSPGVPYEKLVFDNVHRSEGADVMFAPVPQLADL